MGVAARAPRSRRHCRRTTLKSFQDASRIRDAYFPSGGNQPMVSLAIKPPPAPAGWIVKFETGGTVDRTVRARPRRPAPLGPLTPKPTTPPPAAAKRCRPRTVQWPGASPRTAVSVAAEGGGPSLGARQDRSVVAVSRARGRLACRSAAEAATASFIVGGQELRYQITAGSTRNPLNMAVLREFRCPTGNLSIAMRCGLFGKLPAKRDFIASPRRARFSMPGSRGCRAAFRPAGKGLGDRGSEAYPDRADLAVLARRRYLRQPGGGAFMSSLDGVGRYYPLTVFACADPGATIAPPDIDAQDEWFARRRGVPAEHARRRMWRTRRSPRRSTDWRRPLVASPMSCPKA